MAVTLLRSQLIALTKNLFIVNIYMVYVIVFVRNIAIQQEQR